MDEQLALRLGALRLARRRGRLREAAWAAARLRVAGVSLGALGFDPGTTSGKSSAQSTQAIKDFQNANGLTADGEAGPKTRAQLFGAYFTFLFPDVMTKADFLARGADSGGKGDYQGCSEFNPLMMFSADENTNFNKPENKPQRNAENAVNRRVMSLLFRPGTVINTGKWPCPRASEGIGGCQQSCSRRSGDRQRR